MNIIEISNKFPTEFDAIKYFEKIRWGKKKTCPYCESESIGERNKDSRWHCKSCDKSFSVTTNTQIHGVRIGLKEWLYAFSIITDAKKGVSALQLQRNLSISYPTALTMYHKIRELMMIENAEILDNKLNDIVEMDETYVGGKPRHSALSKYMPTKDKTTLDNTVKHLQNEGYELKTGNRKIVSKLNNKRGRGTDKIPVVGMVEREGNVIAEVMDKLTYKDLSGMVKKYVDRDDSVLITDEFSSYNKFNNIIEHVTIDHKKMYSYRGLNTNTIESFWAIIKRQIIGQHHQVSAKYLPQYVAEAVFKFNNRNKDDMFITLVKFSMLDRQYS